MQMKPNKMFDHILWVIGKSPHMILDGKHRKLDVVAKTILDGPAFGDAKSVEGTLAVLAGDMRYETRFGFKAPQILSCWDFINCINAYFHDLDLDGLYVVEKLRVKGDQLIIECSTGSSAQT